MKRIIFVVAAVTAGCQSGQASVSADGGKPRAAASARAEGGARFFARAAAGAEHELALRKLTVDVTRRPGTVHSHLIMEVAAGIEGQAEALIRLPVPRGAAVVDAVLWVNDRPMRGAFVERQRARDIYTSIVVGRRDPALVTWDGPGWIAVSIFPLEKNRPRRFELDWIEPAAEVEGRVMYRVPVISEGDRVVGRASVTVDGRRLRGATEDLVALG